MAENLGYIRVSTVEQNEGRQLKALENYNIKDKYMYVEKASAKDTNRPILKKLINDARKGDTVYISSFDRIARNTKDLLNIVEDLEDRGIKLVSVKENIDTNTGMGKFMLTMLGAIAELERSNLLERQKEGIAIAKAEGKYKGRKSIEIDDNFIRQYERFLKREITTKTALAKELNISRTTLYKMIEEYEKKEN